MADENKTSTNNDATDKTGKDDVSTLTAEQLQEKMTLLENSLKQREDKIKEYEALIDEDKKKAYEKREKAKEEARQALIDAQKFQDAYKTLEDDFKEYKKTFNEDSYKEIQKKHDRLYQSIRNELLERLDESDRETFKNLEIDQLKVVVEKLARKVDPVTVDTTAHHKSKQGANKKWSEMNQAERDQLSAADPVKTQELIAEYMKDKRK